jgi:hypothetical protein
MDHCCIMRLISNNNDGDDDATVWMDLDPYMDHK